MKTGDIEEIYWRYRGREMMKNHENWRYRGEIEWMDGCDQLTVVIMKIIRINHSYPIKWRIYVRNELEMVIFKIGAY